MYKKIVAIIICLLCLFEVQSGNKFYIANQKPLVEQPYTSLPLGSIRPQGMLLEMLSRQRNGLTGCMDSIYSVVCGDRNGWLGGTGDGWERGPYWIDGLLPLAYILDDQTLKERALKWVEWSLNNQREDGNFGPMPLPENYIKLSGVQQELRDDWWPKMVMLKVLQQYYMATEDIRVINFMIRYFKYQHETLPKYPLGHWTFWANRRGSDNLAIVYWLYNVTKERFLLDLGELLHQQTYDWTEVFSSNKIRMLNPYPSLHCVNVAQGLKSPIIYYQRHPDEKYLNAVKEGLSALKDCHGFVNGMFGGDERLHGNDPTQGSELCTAVEMMYSFESILPITGDVYYADYLEKIAYNVLPTQITDDFMYKQYFQQTNQILVSADARNFFNDDNGRLTFGRITGCSCCLTNMHQGWPKFVQNLWYATVDNGLAALVYGASKVTAKVGNGQTVTIIEDTDYPFKESVRFTIHTSEDVRFPLHLRVPLWCKSAHLKVNNEELEMGEDNITVINRRWKSGDTVELVMDMDFRFTRWHENSLGIERGPLVYALKVKEDWRKIEIEGMTDKELWEVYPKSAWNYAILGKELKKGDLNLSVSDTISDYPWNLKNAPIQIRAKALRLPEWRIQNYSAGKVMVPPRVKKDSKNAGSVVEDITLIPYGCTTLRISQFPVIE
ncbi:beta-L-arabinofuranosidase domain-containing protein [Bacteroides congonensis]|uniref:beta-L-arabinofuranosidase domain-containing protein n=1 Tax=Bacteroides congonensis TaxID=1871006 RepID=UPI003A887CCA